MIEFNTKNPELNTKKIKMSPHAYARAAERFNKRNKEEALGHFRGILRQAQKIGETTCEKGNRTILYAYQRHAVYLSLDLTTIITVNRFENTTYEPIKDKMVSIHRKEFNKLERQERSTEKKLKLLQLESAIEIAQLNYRSIKTRSQNVKKECSYRIEELEAQLKNMEEELHKIKSSKRQVARSMVSVL